MIATARRTGPGGVARQFGRVSNMPAFAGATRNSVRSFHFTRMTMEEAKKEEETKEEKTEEKEEETKESQALKALAEKEKEFDELKKNYLTTLADMQNLRTRTTNDVNSAKKYGGQSFAKSMLEVADNFTMALNAGKEHATDANPQLKTFYEGMIMTEKSLLKAFASNDVTKMESLGAKFDPNLHDAMFAYEDATKEPDTVGQVVKDGYMLKDRVLRAAQCGTVKASPKKD